MNRAAFFDLDGTLLTVNSGSLWIKSEQKLGNVSRLVIAEFLIYHLAYKFGLINMEYVMNRLLRTIKGQKEDLIQKRTEEWFHRDVVQFVAKEAKACIEKHRKQGHKLILLTSSSKYESGAALKYFGLDAYLSMLYELDAKGYFTGKVATPVCYGRDKVYYAKQYAEKNDIDLSQSYFYSDSITDLPMLETVGHPIAVNPDPRLKKKAASRAWPILHWNR